MEHASGPYRHRAPPFEQISAALQLPGRQPAPLPPPDGLPFGGFDNIAGAARFKLDTPALDAAAAGTVLAAARARYAAEQLGQSLRLSVAALSGILSGAGRHQGVTQTGDNAPSPPR
ncbi:hypothetical protein [Rugamonas sp.]|uniref:hypothetical protein n=1 Tax=Rugamonas sp. TaxID=1926287 RepID=UPI0025F840C8|nr:hypothetical protein [Rugamonas sp.]